MKNIEPYCIESSAYDEALVEIALAIAGKVNISKENPIMKIKIKGNLILDFSGKTINQVLELYLDE